VTAEPVLILASGSPRRRALLDLLGVPFRVVPSEVEEKLSPKERPADFVRRLALRKAGEVARDNPDAWTLGADTIVVLDGEVLGKPADEADALAMLVKLSGREHIVYTGVALVHRESGYAKSGCETTRVTFRAFSAEEAQAYVKTGEPMDKAGAYGAQAVGTLLIEKIEGSYTNVVGLPLTMVIDLLDEAGLIDVAGEGGRMYALRRREDPGA